MDNDIYVQLYYKNTNKIDFNHLTIKIIDWLFIITILHIHIYFT